MNDSEIFLRGEPLDVIKGMILDFTLSYTDKFHKKCSSTLLLSDTLEFIDSWVDKHFKEPEKIENPDS